MAESRRLLKSADELLTVVEASGALGIRPSTLRHWICSRKIEVVKYGNGIVRIRRTVLEKYLASCTIRANREQRHGRTKKPRLLEGSGVGRADESVAR